MRAYRTVKTVVPFDWNYGGHGRTRTYNIKTRLKDRGCEGVDLSCWTIRNIVLNGQLRFRKRQGIQRV